ncbi:uncharacterized protein [Anser cygnoides]|uniref:Coiled-coil domain-containing protein 81 n=2 Tax=Anser cygnoides TaxID=8845 RepID=A0A8B9DW13_ANSCY|nr:uncharacterized protein LOC106029684 isoform X2 [Anser cygnoides]
MSMNATSAKARKSSCMKSTRIALWDSMQRRCLMPNVTAKEQTDVWNTVAGYVLQQLLQCKGVRIPTLGSFDIIQKRIQAGDTAVILQWPVFHLATNLINTHHLVDSKGSLPAHKKLEPLRRAKVAADACVSWQKAESCIRGTMSLISQCLREGENIALVLRDVGVLLIEGTGVEMKFYYDFLEMLCGKEDLQNAVLKVPQLMDTVVSRLAVVASLTSSGRVVIFPEFDVELLPKSSSRKPTKASGKLPGEEKKKKDGVLPPLSQGKKASAGLLDLPFTVRSSIPKYEIPRLKETKAAENGKKSGISQLPVIPGLPPAKNQPLASQGKRKLTTRSETPGTSQAQAATPQGVTGEERGVEQVLRGGGLPTIPTKTSYRKLSHPLRPLTVKKVPQIIISSPSSSEESLPLRPHYNTSLLMPTLDSTSRTMVPEPSRARRLGPQRPHAQSEIPELWKRHLKK